MVWEHSGMVWGCVQIGIRYEVFRCGSGMGVQV